jgi:Lrp/AsnC family transcriptional regulator, regulator for asnA, asnC and gidA
MDELDHQILQALQEDGRMPFTQIAKIAGVAESTIRNRYASLVEQGIVQTISVIDPFSVGYRSPALIGVCTEPGSIEAVAHIVEQMPEVSYLVMTLGTFDLMVEVFCRDVTHLTEFVSTRLQTVPGVRSTQTLVIGKIYKLSFFWQPFDGMPTDRHE